MNNINIHVPPMPKPEDFGITDEIWKHASAIGPLLSETDVTRAARARITAYKEALAAWKDAVAGLKTS
jgi:hypothetical protein